MPSFDRPFACPWRSRRHSGHIRRGCVLACRPLAQPLRRQGAPRGRAPHLRQPDAKLGADRRGVAAAAARPQRAAGPDRLDVSHRRVRRSRSRSCRLRSRSPASRRSCAPLTGSRTGAILAAALFALNPNVLYLQSTPMTEPLLFALTSLVVLHLSQWAKSDRCRRAPGRRLDDRRRVPDALRSVADRRRGHRAGRVGEVAARLRAFTAVAARERAGWRSMPVATVVFFMGLSFAIDRPMVRDRRLLRARSEAAGTAAGASTKRSARVWSIWPARASCSSPRGRFRSSCIAALLRRYVERPDVCRSRCVASVALPFYAFFSGHPFRIRYEVPLILGGAACIGTAVSLLRFAAPLVAIPLLSLVMLQAPPFDARTAPMMSRRSSIAPTASAGAPSPTCLQRSYDGTHDHGEHGIARALHAGAVARRIRSR